MAYIKHLVECNCVLPQFKKIVPPVFHKFIVFSVIKNETGEVEPSFVKCPNCKAIHHVTEIHRTTKLQKEDMTSLPTEEEIRASLPEFVSRHLETHKCDLATHQEVKHVLENHLWGTPIILTKERVNPTTFSGKYMIILGENLFKIDTFITEEESL